MRCNLAIGFEKVAFARFVQTDGGFDLFDSGLNLAGVQFYLALRDCRKSGIRDFRFRSWRRHRVCEVCRVHGRIGDSGTGRSAAEACQNGAEQKRQRCRREQGTSGLRQAVCNILSFVRPRLTFSKISVALAVHSRGFGAAL